MRNEIYLPEATEAHSFEKRLEAEREALITAWIAFLEIQKARKIPLPPYYADAFNAAKKIKKKENYLLNILVEGKQILKSFLAKIPNSKILEKLDIRTANIRDYIKKIDELEKELSFLKESYLKDSLTGLWNISALEKFFSEIVIPNIYKKDYLLCYLDLDNFKKINDNFGHKIGNRVIITFGNFLKQNFKEKDFICRLHGDEFCIIVTDTIIPKFIEFAEKIYKNGFKIELPKERNIQMKFSIGITNIIATDTLDKALERADMSMYFCKKNKKIKPIRA